MSWSASIRKYARYDVCRVSGGGFRPNHTNAQALLLTLVGAKSLAGVVRAGFARLLLYLHIDRSPIVALEIPNYTRTWGSVSLNVSCELCCPAGFESNQRGARATSILARMMPLCMRTPLPVTLLCNTSPHCDGTPLVFSCAWPCSLPLGCDLGVHRR